MADDKAVSVPLGLIPWALSIALSIGAASFSVHTTSTQVAEVAHKLDEHIAAPGHPVEIQHVEQLEHRFDAQATDQRGQYVELRAAVERTSQNIVALCAATRGAQCQR